METYPNQKIIRIRKQKYKDNFLQIGIDEWMEASKKLTFSAFKIYLYLSGNANGFNLALSKQAIENDLCIKKTAYYDAIKELESLGYIHTIQGNIKEFTTTPYTAQSINTENGEEEQKRHSAKTEYFSEDAEAVSEKANGAVRKNNIEIDNIDKINKTNKGELTPDGVNSCGQKPAASNKKWWRDEWGKTKPNETLEEFVRKIGRGY